MHLLIQRPNLSVSDKLRLDVSEVCVARELILVLNTLACRLFGRFGCGDLLVMFVAEAQ